MSDKLLKASNTVLRREQPVFELLDENISLNRKNHLLWAGLIGLSALSAFSIYSCYKNAKALKATRSENAFLTQTVARFQKDTANLEKEKNRLEAYKAFVHSIDGFYPEEMIDIRSDEEANNMHQESIQMQKKYDDACKTLGINPVELSRLKARE